MMPNEVLVEDRVRKDMGNIDELAASIKEFGIIEPIILGRDNKLIAGERRLRALSKLSIELEHGKHFIYNDEVNDLRRKAMEVEENVKRKELSWQEQVLGKKRLLDLLQLLHGVAGPGNPGRTGGEGFGINKLAAMLGESNAQTSKDVELAGFLLVAPQLRLAETKEAARRQAVLAVAVAQSLQQQSTQPQQTDKKWVLYEGDFRAYSNQLSDGSCDLVLTDPPYGEDVQAMGANSRVLLAQPFADTRDATLTLLSHCAREAYRVLREDRFAYFFFGFQLYDELLGILRREGFDVDVTPLVWVKTNVINTSPYTRYGRSYEPILVARKGEPKLLRPAQRDVIQIENVSARGISEQKLYQAQKPSALMEKLILDSTIVGMTVVDFFAGSGSTGEAAIRNGRRTTLFEIDPIACNIIKSRLGVIP